MLSLPCFVFNPLQFDPRHVTRPRTRLGGAINCATDSEAERREKLRLLFGEQTADRLVPESTKAVDPEFLMLVEGMQRLEWGATRLVDVSMAPGPLEISLEPLLPSGTSELLCARLDMPLGLVIEEGDLEDDATVPGLGPQQLSVIETTSDGSAAKGGVLPGDLLRGTTFVTMGMSYPTWQLIVGGVGRPTLQKQLMPTLGQSFEQVMAALSSNSQEGGNQGNGQIVLLLERKLLSRTV